MIKMPCITVLFFTIFLGSTCFHGFCDAQIFGFKSRRSHSPGVDEKYRSTVLIPVGGRVYPEGNFYATFKIGQPPKSYHLDVDTGSDLTWVQCDAPCVRCLKGPHPPYTPHKNLVLCNDPLCSSIDHPPNYPCHNPADQCDYEVDYADRGSSMGVLVKDNFHLQLVNRSDMHPTLTFGCGYDQEVQGSNHSPFVDGVVGLANGKSSILSQLHGIGVTRNVAGHCFRSDGGGYLFFGDDHLPSSGIAWVPMTKNSLGNYYSVGPAELRSGGKNVIKRGLDLIFDTGSTYTYFTKGAYMDTLSVLKKDMNSNQLEDAPEDKTLPVCWKGRKPFKSLGEARKFFKPLTLHFKNEVMEMPPESYLIVSNKGNVCLGIMDGSQAELGNLNVLGDISLLDKLIIYDNEKRRIGWGARVPENTYMLTMVTLLSDGLHIRTNMKNYRRDGSKY